MSDYQDQDRMLALAGVYQAAALVHQLATQGKSDTQALTASLNSLFVENPTSTADVFGGVDALVLGMRTMKSQMQNKTAPNEQRNLQITHYILALIAIEKQLSKRPEVLKRLFHKLNVPDSQRNHFGILHDNTLAGMALVYTEVLSNLKPKIMVRGAHGYLSQAAIANRVRATLLAGVRAVTLWRQVGGSRWHLLFKRSRYVQQLDMALAYLNDQQAEHNDDAADDNTADAQAKPQHPRSFTSAAEQLQKTADKPSEQQEPTRNDPS